MEKKSSGMEKKSSGRKSLKSLFSRSDRGGTEKEEKKEKEKKEEEEDKTDKKFKFPKFRMKPRSGSEQQKTPGEKQRMLSAGEASKPAEDGESWTDGVTPDTKRSSLYATTSRAKGKDFSYSELDLRKPKKFATFSFGFRKKKKKDEENLSSSTFGLQGAGIEEKDETSLDFGQMKLDQSGSKRFSLSQPELDSSNAFDIPSPPPVARNQSQSDLSHALRTDQSEPKEPDETLKAPIASIPELQLHDSGNNDLNTQNASRQDEVDASDRKDASRGEEILQESEKNPESSSVSTSLLKPEAQIDFARTSFEPSESKTNVFAAGSNSAKSSSPSFKPSMTTSDSKNDVFPAESTSADSPALSFKPSESKTDVFAAGSNSAKSSSPSFKPSMTTSDSKNDVSAAKSTNAGSPTSSFKPSESKIDVFAAGSNSADSPALTFTPSESKNDVSTAKSANADSPAPTFKTSQMNSDSKTNIPAAELTSAKSSSSSFKPSESKTDVFAAGSNSSGSSSPSFKSSVTTSDSKNDISTAKSSNAGSSTSTFKPSLMSSDLKTDASAAESSSTDSPASSFKPSESKIDVFAAGSNSADLPALSFKPSATTSDSKTNIPAAESTSAKSSSSSFKPSTTTSDSKTDAFAAESTSLDFTPLLMDSDSKTSISAANSPPSTFKPSATSPDSKPGVSAAGSASVRREISASQTDRSAPEATKTSSERKVPDSVYGALYDSLFPENFTSEVVNSLLKLRPHVSSPSSRTPRIHTEIPEADPVRTYSFSSPMSTPGSFASTFTSYQTSPSCRLQRSPEIRSSLDSCSDNVPYSELTRLHSVSNSPVPDSVTSPETDSRVSDSKRRVIVVRESLADEETAAAESSSKSLELRIKAVEQMDGPDGPLSPAYLSVGSDEGSAAEIYYSAEEDQDGEDEDMFTVDVETEEKEKKKRVVFVKTKSEEVPEQDVVTVLRRSDAKKTENEDAETVEKTKESLAETELLPGPERKRIVFVKVKSEEEGRGDPTQEWRTSEVLRSRDAKTVEEKDEAKTFRSEEKDEAKTFKSEEKDGAKTFKSEEKDGAKTFKSEEKDKAKTFKSEEKDGAKTFKSEEEDGAKTTELLPDSALKKVVFVKMKSEEDKSETGEKEEVLEKYLGEFLRSSDAKEKESEDAETVDKRELPEPEKKRIVFVKMRSEEEKMETPPEKSERKKESEDAKTLPETDMKKVVFVKTRSEEEKKETEKQPRGQESEMQTQEEEKSEMIPDSGVKKILFVKMRSEEEKSEEEQQKPEMFECLEAGDAKEEEKEESLGLESRNSMDLLPDSGILKTIEAVKMQQAGDKSETEQQPRGQTFEVSLQDFGESEVPAGIDAKKKESEESFVVKSRKETELNPETSIKSVVKMDKSETEQPMKSQKSETQTEESGKSEFPAQTEETFVMESKRDTKVLPEMELKLQIKGQKSEIKLQDLGKSEFIAGSEETTVAESIKETKVLPEMEIKQQIQDQKSEIKLQDLGKSEFIAGRDETRAVGSMKETKLLPETEIKQQIRRQKPEHSVQKSGLSEFLAPTEETLVIESKKETKLLPETDIKQQIKGQKSEIKLQNLAKSELLAPTEESSMIENRKETKLLPETETKQQLKGQKSGLSEFVAQTDAIESVKETKLLPETEIKQQIKGQKSEMQLQMSGKSEFVAGKEESFAVSNKKEMKLEPEMEIKQQKSGKSEFLAKPQEGFTAENRKETNLLPETEIKQQLKGQKSENSDLDLGKSAFPAGREETLVVESVKETKLLPETEIKQQIMGQKSEIKLQMSGKSEFVAGREESFALLNRKETKLHPEMEIKQQIKGQKSDNSDLDLAKSEFLAGREESFAVGNRKEAKLHQEMETKQQKSANLVQISGISDFFAQPQEGFTAENRKETNLLPETEIKQQLKGQKSENSDLDLGKSEFVAGREESFALSNEKETKLHQEMEIKQQKSANLVQKSGKSEFLAKPQEGFPAENRKETNLLPGTEIKQQLKGDKSGLSEFVAAAAAQPAPPVQQVNTGQVCSEAPPPGPGEEPQVETETHVHGGKQEGRIESSGGPEETSRGPEGGEEHLNPHLKTEGASLGKSPAGEEEDGRNPDVRRTKPTVKPRPHNSLQAPPVFCPSAEQESEDVMSSGYSSLSTKLSFKSSSPPREDESKQRFRKVSLVGDGDDAPDSNRSESEPEFRWKNRFEGVTQFRESRDEDSSGPPETLQHLDSSSSSSSTAERHVTREGRSYEGEEPAGETGAQVEAAAAQRISDRTETQQLQQLPDESEFSGVFKATLVELVSDPAAPPASPEEAPQQEEEDESPIQSHMDSLVDTLRSMGPSMRPRTANAVRPAAPQLMSSLPPIVEDAASPVTGDAPDGKKVLNGLYTLPADLGLRAPRDSRSPLELMKQSQDLQLPGSRGLNLPLRGPTSNPLGLRKPSDSSPEDLQSTMLNGNGVLPSSRLDNSVLFGGYRSSSIDQTLENGKAHRPLFRTGSLPETGLSSDRISVGPKDLGDPSGTRFERFAFLVNSSPQSGSLTGSEDGGRMSRPPPLGIGSPLGVGSPPHSNSPTRLLSPTGSIDLHRAFGVPESPLSMSAPILQRSFSSDGLPGVQTSLFANVHGGSQFQSQEPEPDRNLVSKYRAFPDAYLTKEKEHGKLNPRPGKMYIFDRPGMCGQRTEVRGDVVDATEWELQETISIRVVRGGWVLYEKPNFKGEKIALDEGDIELTYPYNLPEEEMLNGQKDGGQTDEQTEEKPARRFIIGSIRRAVRDYSVPEISLFPEENAEGKKVIFRDTSEDARIFGFPIKANSIIINAGLWLVYAQPFFQGVPRVLEVGGYTNPAAWGVEQPYVGSLHPLKVGEPRVENLSEPKIVIYDKPYFSGKSRSISSNMKDFMTRTDRQQTAFMYNVGSLKVLGGIWVGYEKEGFRGNQYLLEEGEYQDWRVWGGIDAELRSVRLIRADLSEPLLVMFEQPEEEQEGVQDENTFEVTEAIPDVELFGYKTSTRSIHVLSGAWIIYSHVDFSGNQYILEKGFYNNCADWGSVDSRVCSVQPILLAPNDSSKTRNEITLYSEPDFEGQCHVVDRNQEAVSEKVLTKSCRVSGGSWVLYDSKAFSGNMFVLSEGDYPSLSSMGCPAGCTIRSIKVVPTMFSLPSISLFGLECLEGREITTDTEMVGLVEEGFNNHILSVRVNSGCWVICEHSNYRGRQFLLEPIEITNWPKFSSMQTIGSMYPIRQKRHFFRVKNKERGHFLSVQGGVEEMKSGRVVVTPEVEPMSDVWFYQDGLIKNKLSPTMSLQVVGNVEPGAKVVLWTENRQPVQMWTAQTRGLISSLTFQGFVLDVKGGKSYDKDHVVVLPENEDRPSQQWEMELL